MKGLFPRVLQRQLPLRVHTELHRLVTELQDATDRMVRVPAEDREGYLDAYAAYTQRRKELYEWVMARIERPRDIHSLLINF